MRIRFRPAYNDAELAQIYAEPHQHAGWPDHVLRVEATIALARDLFAHAGIPRTIADLSCGDAAIAGRIAAKHPEVNRLYLGDLAAGYEYHGPIERTITEIPRVDLLICTETIEHLDCPDGLLIAARAKAGLLVLSTPLGENNPANAEHYWGWDHEGVREMLDCAAWETVLQQDVTWKDGHDFSWSYQIWGCR